MKLREAREAAGLSQADLARLVNIPQPRLPALEQGRTDVRLSTIRRFAKALACNSRTSFRPNSPQGSVSQRRRDICHTMWVIASRYHLGYRLELKRRSAVEILPVRRGSYANDSRGSNAQRGTSLHDPSIVSHGQHQSWSGKFLVVISSRTGTRISARESDNRRHLQSADTGGITEYKLSPRDNRSTEQALPLRQMLVKSVIPVWTFLSFTEVIPQ